MYNLMCYLQLNVVKDQLFSYIKSSISYGYILQHKIRILHVKSTFMTHPFCLKPSTSYHSNLLFR